MLVISQVGLGLARWSVCTGLCAVAWLGGGWVGGGSLRDSVVLDGDGPKKEAPKVATAGGDARAELKKADEVRRAIHGKGEERRAALEKAAAAYETFLTAFPDAKEESASAAFRLGEIRRLLGKADEAREAFAKVVASGGSRRLSARAVLETAHIYRRAKELGKALDTYRRAAVEFADETGTRDEALHWVGAIHEQNKEYGKSREAWQAVADRGVDPLDRVRAFDRISQSHLKEGHRPEALAAIEQAKAALHDIAADPSARGARVKKALSRMRAVRLLEDGEGSPKKANAKKGSSGGGGDGNEDEDEDEDDEE